MKKLKDLTTEQILRTYEFPYRFCVYFVSQIAKDALSKINNPDERSLRAVDVAERFGNGEDFTEKELKEVRTAANAAANAAAYAATYAATNAAYAAYTAADAATYAATYAADAAAYAAANAAYAADATTYAADAAGKYNYKSLLLELIKTRLSKVERLLIFGESA